MNKKVTAIAALSAALVIMPAQAQFNVEALADEVEPQVITWRRHIHQNPELAFQEEQTAAYIAAALRAMPGIEMQT